MPELRRFSASDLAELDRLGQVKEANALRLGASQVERIRGTAAASTDGIKGEWAVRDSLGLPRLANVTGRADPGYDVIGPEGRSIQVRYTPYRTGRLMCLAIHPISATAVVLVTAGRSPAEVKIVGGVWRVDFYERCHRRDFGHGLTDYLEQSELEDWLRFRGKL